MQTDHVLETSAQLASKAEETKEPKENRKQILMRKKAKNHDKLPPVLQEELDEILAAEKAEHDRAAMVHKLSMVADTWGRKEISGIKKEVTARVRMFSVKESKEVEQQLKACRSELKDLRTIAEKAMKDLQEKLNETLAQYSKESDAKLGEIRAVYKDLYKDAELELQDRVDQTLGLVGDFTTVLSELSNKQLKELSSSGVLQVGKGDFLVVPGAEQPEKA